MKNYVSYKDFGAVGNGINNDFFAIKAAHEYANKMMLPVRGDKDATYLIGSTETDGIASSIEIKTDTDWCGAKFIFDDRYIEEIKSPHPRTYNTMPIKILGNFAPFPLSEDYIKSINSAGGIHKGKTDRLGEGFGFPAMLVLYNKNTKHFIRYGGNRNNGDSQKEIFVIDEKGFLDKDTPVLFDFEEVSSGVCIRLDETPITVENAKFTSLASRINLVDHHYYISRGIKITRPNTLVRKIEHEIVGELLKYQPVDRFCNPVEGYRCDPQTHKVYDKDGVEVTDGSVAGYIGPGFAGFIVVHESNNTVIEDCVFQARVYYLQGTYDLSLGESNNITIKNCTQRNFFSGLDPEHPKAPAMGRWWGVMGSNYCKNMVYDGCRLTRYDAHCGVTNGKILNSEIASMTLIGGGDLLIENSTFYVTGTFLNLRSDYGATWDGTITVKNSTILDPCEKGAPLLLFCVHSANHYFGYKTHFPNVIIDNLKIEAKKEAVSFINDHWTGIFSPAYRAVTDPALAKEGAICANGEENKNVYEPPKFIKVINNENNGYDVELFDVPFFENTELVNIKKIPYEKK